MSQNVAYLDMVLQESLRMFPPAPRLFDFFDFFTLIFQNPFFIIELTGIAQRQLILVI